MRNVQNNTALTVTKIHGLTFTVFYIIEQVLSEFVYPYLSDKVSKLLSVFLSAVFAAILYAALYIIIKSIYDKILTIKDKKLNIEGTWYHVHIPHYLGKEDYSQERISAGVTDVSREFSDFTFVGNNDKFYMLNGKLVSKSENSTHWYTKATKLSDDNDFDIIEVYEAKTKGTPLKSITSCPYCKRDFEHPVEIQEAEKFRHGVHKIDIIVNDGKCTQMRAEYSDCWPSLKNGELLFYRTEEERNERIRLFFEEAKNLSQLSDEKERIKVIQ